MNAVIMAGGLGMRLRPLTQIIPKPLLPIGEKSILEITLQKLKNQGFKKVIIAVNYKSDLFESYFGDGSKIGLEIIYSKEQTKLGTAGPLLLVKEQLKEPFLVMNGDILTNMDFNKLREFHIHHQADITLVTKIIHLPLQYGVIEKNKEIIINIREKPNIESEINAGIYFLNPKVLEFIPIEKEFSMPELMKTLIKMNKRVLAYPLEEYWLDIGQMDDFNKAQKDVENGLV